MAEHVEPARKPATKDAASRPAEAAVPVGDPYYDLLNARPKARALDTAGRPASPGPVQRRATTPPGPAGSQPIQRAVRTQAAAPNGIAGAPEGPSESGGPVVQLQINRTGLFAEKGGYATALAKLEAVLAKDDLVGALYKDAVADRSDLTFTTGEIGSKTFGGTVIHLGGTMLKSEKNFLDLVADDPTAVSRRLHMLIMIDDAEVLKATQEGVDVLQTLAHEYGVHATRDFAFVGALRKLQNNPGKLKAHISAQVGGTGPQTEDAHHSEHGQGLHGEYNMLSEALLPTLGSDERGAFRASEKYDQGEQLKATKTHRLATTEVPSFKFKKKDDAKQPLLAKPQSASSWCGESCCFITTACMRSAGLPDDCEELQVLRWFRDTIMFGFEGGRALGALYYCVSPGIVAEIRASRWEEEIYRRLYRVIRHCVDAVKKGDYLLAFQTYVGVVLMLMQRFPQGARGD